MNNKNPAPIGTTTPPKAAPAPWLWFRILLMVVGGAAMVRFASFFSAHPGLAFFFLALVVAAILIETLDANAMLKACLGFGVALSAYGFAVCMALSSDRISAAVVSVNATLEPILDKALIEDVNHLNYNREAVKKNLLTVLTGFRVEHPEVKDDDLCDAPGLACELTTSPTDGFMSYDNTFRNALMLKIKHQVSLVASSHLRGLPDEVKLAAGLNEMRARCIEMGYPIASCAPGLDVTSLK